MTAKHRTILSALVILAAGFAAYANSFQVPFQLDDLTVIRDNPFMRILHRPNVLFRFDPSRFLTHYSFALNYYFGQWNVVGYHAVNFILHCCNAFWIYLLVGRLLTLEGRNGKQQLIPLFSALIFLAHPLQTQAVTYIVQRSVPLAVFFYLTSLLLYTDLRRNFRWPVYAGFVLCLSAGTMTKPIFWTMPLAAGLIEWYFLKNTPRQKIWLLWGPCALVLIVVPLFLSLFFVNFRSETFDPSKILSATRVDLDVPRLTYLLTQFKALILYLRLLVWPAGQNISYAFELSGSWQDPATLFSFLALLAIFGICCACYRRLPLISFAIAWFFVLMIPESSVFPLPDLVFEHRMYLAVACFGIIVTVLVCRYSPARRAGLYLSVIVLSLILLTFSRNALWNDPIALMEDAVAKAPSKPENRNYLGVLFEKAGMPHLAVKEFEKAVDLDEEFLPAYNNLGRVLAEAKKYRIAKQYFLRALAIRSSYFEANLNLAELYYRSGELDQAFAQFKRTSELRPQAFYPHKRLGDIYRHMKQAGKAEQAYKTAIRYNIGSVETRFDLGNLYLDSGRFRQAIAVYQEILNMFPQFAKAYNTLGIAYAQSGSPDRAEPFFRKAMELDPDDPTVYMNLARLFEMRGDEKTAESFSEQAREKQKQRVIRRSQK